MIITSPFKLEIGKIYTEKNSDFMFEILDTVLDKFAFKVIREASRQDFRDYIFEQYKYSIARRLAERQYFYEIQTD